MKKIVLALSTAAVLAGLPSFATAAPAAPAAADPRTTAAVKSMLDAMEVRKAMAASFAEMERAMPSMMRQQIEAMIKADASMNAEQRQQALAKLDKELPAVSEAVSKLFRDPAILDEMMEEMVPLYARNFTTAEINQMAAFYRTPVGHKMMQVMPKVTAESMAIGQKIITPRLGKMMQDIAQSMQKK